MQLNKMPKYDVYKDSGVEWLGEIPEGWNASRLGGEFLERKEKVSDKDYEPLSVTKLGIVPQLDNAAKTNDGDNRKLVKKGDFVINSRSDRKGSSGVSYLDGSVSLINLVLKPITIKAPFCNYLLKSYAFIEEFYRNGHGIVADLWTTRYWDMKSIILPIPPTHEQTLIAKFLDQKTAQIDKAIEIKHKQIELLKEQKQIVINNTATKGLDPNAPMKDSGIEWIGEIPQGWEVRKLKYLINGKLKYGANESGDYYDESLPRYIRITDFSESGKLSDKTKLSLEWSKAKDYLLKDGDILFARSGATVGKTYQFKRNMSNENYFAFAGYLIKAESNTKIVISDYLYLYTISNLFESWKAIIFNKSTIENIGADKYSELFVTLPTLLEQQQIVAHIDEKTSKIDKAIELQNNQIDKLKEYKASLINSVVTGKVRVP